MVPTVLFKRLASYAGPKTPFRAAYSGDAGFDVYATQDISLPPGARLTAGTGIAIALPTGLEAQVRPKSGLSSVHGITVLNSPGTVDPPYRGEVGVILYNANPVVPASFIDLFFRLEEGSADLTDLKDHFDQHVVQHTHHWRAGEKLGQLVFANFVHPTFEECDELPETTRAGNGYGSSGR